MDVVHGASIVRKRQWKVIDAQRQVTFVCLFRLPTLNTNLWQMDSFTGSIVVSTEANIHHKLLTQNTTSGKNLTTGSLKL